MKKILGLVIWLALLSLLLTACSNDPPLLAEPDEPTMVYIYTDG